MAILWQLIHTISFGYMINTNPRDGDPVTVF